MRLESTGTKRILDFDVETLAAGFADPEWVPQKITCVAWSWVGEDEVHSRICGQLGFFQPERRRKMLKPFLAELEKADIVTGHNILRFDLRVLNSECLRLGLPKLRPVRAQDTIRLPRSKGFKKGQDTLGRLLKVADEKLTLDWQAWEEAYEDPTWKTVVERCESDVLMHKQIREEMLERGWLSEPVLWRP